jgi:hypothetical protein
MAQDRNRLEPLPDGFVAFRTAKGERWKHRDVEDGRTGPGYRLFVSEGGEERRYTFGPHEPHDTTVFDLREQLARATPVAARSGPESSQRSAGTGEQERRPGV